MKRYFKTSQYDNTSVPSPQSTILFIYLKKRQRPFRHFLLFDMYKRWMDGTHWTVTVVPSSLHSASLQLKKPTLFTWKTCRYKTVMCLQQQWDAYVTVVLWTWCYCYTPNTEVSMVHGIFFTSKTLLRDQTSGFLMFCKLILAAGELSTSNSRFSEEKNHDQHIEQVCKSVILKEAKKP